MILVAGITPGHGQRTRVELGELRTVGPSEATAIVEQQDISIRQYTRIMLADPGTARCPSDRTGSDRDHGNKRDVAEGYQRITFLSKGEVSRLVRVDIFNGVGVQGI